MLIQKAVSILKTGPCTLLNSIKQISLAEAYHLCLSPLMEKSRKEEITAGSEGGGHICHNVRLIWDCIVK